MLAKELIQRVVKGKYKDSAYVIAHIPERDSSWHVHLDEGIPEDRPISVRVKISGFKY